MAIGFPPKVTREITGRNSDEILKESEGIFAELGWRADSHEANFIRAYTTEETEFVTIKTIGEKAFVESISSGMKYSDGGRNLHNVNKVLARYGIDTTPTESTFKKYISPRQISILLCFFLLYPVVGVIPDFINFIRMGETEVLQDMIFGYALSWSIHFSAIFLLLKQNKIGWMIAFAFFVFNVVWIGSDFVYSYIKYYDTAFADSNTLFGLYDQMLYRGTDYYLINIITNASAAGIMLVKKYRENFGINKRTFIIALTIGILSGCIFGGILINSRNF